MNTMKDLIKRAEKYVGMQNAGTLGLGKAYAEAVDRFPCVAKSEFSRRFPYIRESRWRALEAVGRGRLLPQLVETSDKFIKALLRDKDSRRHQYMLVGALKDGTICIDRGSGPEPVKLADLTKTDYETISFCLSKQDAGASSQELAERIRKITREVYISAGSAKRPECEYLLINGERCVKFNTRRPFTVGELEAILAKARMRAL